MDIQIPSWFTLVWVIGLSTEILFRSISKNWLRPSVVIGTVFYGLYLIVLRLGNGAVDLFERWEARQKAVVRVVVPVKVANSATEAISVHRLNAGEVVFPNGKGMVRVNLLKDHTLLAAGSGSGKTTMINAILIQLFGQGRLFTDHVDVFLIDLKGDDEHDFLNMWKPLCKRYISHRESENAVHEAITLLGELANDAYRVQNNRQVLVIIDEAADLTSHIIDPKLRKAGIAVLANLASKLRSAGSLILATQYPQFEVLPRAITSNLLRKIGMPVDDPDALELIFRIPPPANLIPQNVGDFLLKEPRERGWKFGHVWNVSMPGEIDAIVFRAIEAAGQVDPRLKFFIEVAGNLQVGANIKGVNATWNALKKSGKTPLSQQLMTEYYRNFANSGGFVAPEGKGMSYKLALPFPEAQRLVRVYIEDGKWEQSPEALI